AAGVLGRLDQGWPPRRWLLGAIRTWPGWAPRLLAGAPGRNLAALHRLARRTDVREIGPLLMAGTVFARRGSSGTAIHRRSSRRKGRTRPCGSAGRLTPSGRAS